MLVGRRNAIEMELRGMVAMWLGVERTFLVYLVDLVPDALVFG